MATVFCRRKTKAVGMSLAGNMGKNQLDVAFGNFQARGSV